MISSTRIHAYGAVLGLMLAGFAGCDSQSRSIPATDPEAAKIALGHVGKITDPAEEVRKNAFRALAEMGPRAAAAVPALAAALSHQDSKVATTSAVVLGKIGPPSLDALRREIRTTTSPKITQACIAALGDVGEAAKPATTDLIPFATATDPATRLRAVRSLGKIYAGVGKPSGLTSFTINDPAAAEAAQTMLGTGGPSVDSPISAGIQRFNPDGGRMRNVARKFGFRPGLSGGLPEEAGGKTVLTFSLGGDAKQLELVLPVLVEALSEDRAPLVRAAAAEALGTIGPGAAPTLEMLVHALEDDVESPVRAAAAKAIGRLGTLGAEALPMLKQAMRDPDRTVTIEAASALAAIAPGALAPK